MHPVAHEESGGSQSLSLGSGAGRAQAAHVSCHDVHRSNSHFYDCTKGARRTEGGEGITRSLTCFVRSSACANQQNRGKASFAGRGSGKVAISRVR